MIKKTILGLIILLIVGGSAATSIYFYQQYEKIKKNPNIVAQEEVKDLVAKVGELMVLPTDEMPSVATVVDKEKLKDQPFFKNSEKDDKILIYTKAQKAILYRPSTHKIIEFAPLAIGEETSTISPEDDTSTPVVTPAKIVLLNGSGKAGITSVAETKIKEIGNIEVLYKSNAAKSDYTSNYIIDLTGGHDDLARQIAESIDGEVRSMVEGETKPSNADILVIVSK